MPCHNNPAMLAACQPHLDSLLGCGSNGQHILATHTAALQACKKIGFLTDGCLQVVMTLGKALEIANDAALGQNYWFGLSKRSSKDIVGGELCLGFRVLDALSYVNVSSYAAAAGVTAIAGTTCPASIL
jgi:hypothetical protein